MATVSVRYEGTNSFDWSGVNGGDTCTPVNRNRLPDKTFQFIGTVSAAYVEGSNDGTNYAKLHKIDGTTSDLTRAGFVTILENPLYIRPVVTTGTDVRIIGSGAE